MQGACMKFKRESGGAFSQRTDLSMQEDGVRKPNVQPFSYNVHRGREVSVRSTPTALNQSIVLLLP